MTTTSETGHAINVANFLDLINFCKGFGTQYQPSKVSIQISSLEIIYAKSQEALIEVVNQHSAYNTVVNARADLFKGKKSLATRLVNAFETSDASEATKNDLKGFNKKLQGKKASGGSGKTVVLDANAVVPKTISTSQQSFTQQIEHLRAMVTILANEPSYKPNEVALKVSTINDLLNQLILANAQVSAVNVALSNARLERDEVLYKEGTGLYDSSLDVKKYVKAIFGATSPAYKQVGGLKFYKR